MPTIQYRTGKPFSPVQVLAKKDVKGVAVEQRLTTRTVTGDEVATRYTVNGLRPHEIPVVGLVVSPTILPGFSYRVRALDTSKHLFSGRALRLLSIGQGYEKELIFEADEGCKNDNDNSFFSDSRPEGYGFELEVIAPGAKFTMYDANHNCVGSLQVIKNEVPQVEQSHLVWPETGIVEKWVVVQLKCKIEWSGGAVSEDSISGIAIASKSTRSGSAQVIRVMNCKMRRNKGKIGMTLMPGVTNDNKGRVSVTGQHIPASYTITGLHSHELPVIGTYTDRRIIPGFWYSVRPACSKKALWQGEAFRLLDIQPGYANSFTFESSLKNDNDHFFCSDNYEDGFAFAPQAVFPGHHFRICINDEEIGTARVTRATKPQVEIQTIELPGGGVVKRLRVEVTCWMEVRGLVTRSSRVTGIAIVLKPSQSQPAALQAIESIGLHTELTKNFRYISGEPKFVAFRHQKYLDELHR